MRSVTGNRGAVSYAPNDHGSLPQKRPRRRWDRVVIFAKPPFREAFLFRQFFRVSMGVENFSAVGSLTIRILKQSYFQRANLAPIALPYS